MLDIENVEKKFTEICSSDAFLLLQEKYNKAKHVFFFGHGGNMSIAEHAAIDASRITDKNVYAPGGGVIVTSIQGDTNFNDWIMNWLDIRTRYLDKSDCVAIGLSCSTNGISSDCLTTALNWASDNGMETALWAAQPKEKDINENVLQIIQHAKHYHTSEVLSLMMTYQLIHGAGFVCPTISKKAQERRFEKLGIESEIKTFNQDTPPGMENQHDNIGVDFDGVVHTFDKGWHDGTCYGAPIEGALEAIKTLSKSFNVIIFSAKVRPDRPLVGGQTGYELVDEWLQKHGVRDYVSEITHEKPRAKFYIDDKAIEFSNNWKEILKRLS
jgi:D-sedoheptulose 7-phosphate isomerase